MVEQNSENFLEETEYQERYRLYEKAYDNDSNLISLNSSDFNKAIRYFSATLLVLLFTGINFQDSNPTFFKAVFILGFLTFVSNLLAYPFSQCSLKKHRVYAEYYFLQRDHSYRHKQHWTSTASFFLECLSVILFTVVVSLLIFGFFANTIIIKGVQ